MKLHEKLPHTNVNPFCSELIIGEHNGGWRENCLNTAFLERHEFVQTLVRAALKQKQGKHAQLAQKSRSGIRGGSQSVKIHLRPCWAGINQMVTVIAPVHILESQKLPPQNIRLWNVIFYMYIYGKLKCWLKTRNYGSIKHHKVLDFSLPLIPR